MERPSREGPPPDSGTENPDFHEVWKERKDLKHELLSRTDKSWVKTRQAVDEEQAISEPDVTIEAILTGHIADLPAAGMQGTPEGGQTANITSRLAKLDQTAAGFNKDDEVARQHVQESFAAEKPERDSERAYKNVEGEMTRLTAFEEHLAKQEFALARSRKGRMTAVDQKTFATIARQREAIAARRERLASNAETAPYSRMAELTRYQEGLRTERFADTPSRRVYEEWVRRQWEAGKAVMLEGATGTGKTELLVHMAKALYGEQPEVLRCTPRTGPAEIFGKILLREGEQGGTVTYFQHGRYTNAITRGVPLVMDEFNQLETPIRFGLKELYNRGPGSTVTIQENSGHDYPVKPGFAFAATSNLKSGRHKERFELDAAESRVFAMKEVAYLPKEELYDVCLAVLMDASGGVPVTRNEALTTLKYLCDAADESQKAYEGKEMTNTYGMGGARGGKPMVEKAVLDPGQALQLLEGFAVSRAQGLSLQEHLNRGLLDFVRKGDYPEKDRELLVRMLVSKGFLHDVPTGEFGLTGLLGGPRHETDLLADLRGRVAPDVAERGIAQLNRRQVAELDPYGVRRLAHEEQAEDFLHTVGSSSEAIREQGGETTFERAEMFMGSDLLGPDAVRETFGIDVEVVPAIPFSEDELARAKALGQMLVLRVDRAADSTPLTMQKMEALLSTSLQSTNKGKVLHSTDWYKNENFFITETPTAGWALVSKDVIPNSTSKNYHQQTEVLAEYVRTKVFRGEPIPTEYEAALTEWDTEKDEIAALVDTNWQEAAKRLEALQITQLTRQSPADVLYDGLMRLQARSERLLESTYTWTKRRTAGGRLVCVGFADAGGALVGHWNPDNANDALGVSFSRSH